MASRLAAHTKKATVGHEGPGNKKACLPVATTRLRARTGISRTAVLSALCALAAVLASPVAAAQATTQTFSYTGGEQTFTVPAGVTSLEAVATGGSGGSAAGAGGSAALVTGTVSVTPGETLYVEVGGNGQDGGPDGNSGASSGGFNGGGAGGAGGGGASDVRTSPAVDGLSPDDRLIVAGGGGGSGQNGGCTAGAGGNAEQAGKAVAARTVAAAARRAPVAAAGPRDAEGAKVVSLGSADSAAVTASTANSAISMLVAAVAATTAVEAVVAPKATAVEAGGRLIARAGRWQLHVGRCGRGIRGGDHVPAFGETAHS